MRFGAFSASISQGYDHGLLHGYISSTGELWPCEFVPLSLGNVLREDFAKGMEFLRRVGDLAEQEGHHPDVHLTGYRNVTIELSTHAVDGLSENDFILASKIDELPAGDKT